MFHIVQWRSIKELHVIILNKPLLYELLQKPIQFNNYIIADYRPPEGGRLYDMKVVSGYAFLRTYYV